MQVELSDVVTGSVVERGVITIRAFPLNIIWNTLYAVVAVFVKDMLRTDSSVTTDHWNAIKHVEECKYKIYHI